MVYSSIVCGKKEGHMLERCKRTGISQMLSYASGIIAQILSMQNPPHKGVIVIEEL
jgi:saccharopine dehydrogenase-like NADP-dependent oxidoreductase